MEVVLAKSAGFCFGVKRAVDTVYELAEKGEKIYTFGPIIHNEEVVKDLEKKGVAVIESREELAKLTKGTVVIRSHGVAREIYEQIERQGLACVDATCPFVRRIHRIVEKESAAGKQILIIGNAGHPEVEGIMGWSVTPAIVAETKEEMSKLNVTGKNRSVLCHKRHLTTINFKNWLKFLKKEGMILVL